MNSEQPDGFDSGLRKRLHRIVFGVDTPAGKGFDVALLVAILLSVATVLLESVPRIQTEYGMALRIAEWVFTILFTIEYALRIWIFPRPTVYVRSFYGIVDLLAILPTYVSLFVTGSQTLAVVRGIRLLRVFRVLKLVRYLREANALMKALRTSRAKITVFLTGVVCVALVFGTAMYLIEGDEAGFTSIPTSVYWAVVTMTTVGYGDIAPETPFGQFVALVLMILGYAIIAVPTGIVSAELVRSSRAPSGFRACPRCAKTGHDEDASYCNACGTAL